MRVCISETIAFKHDKVTSDDNRVVTINAEAGPTPAWKAHMTPDDARRLAALLMDAAAAVDSVTVSSFPTPSA